MLSTVLSKRYSTLTHTNMHMQSATIITIILSSNLAHACRGLLDATLCDEVCQ
jgi:hypothetical protein